MTDQTDSPHATLLRDLDAAAAGVQRLDRLDAESAAKAIRHLSDQLDEVSEARDRLEDEVARLTSDRDRLATIANDHAGELDSQGVALTQAQQERDRLAGEVERLQGMLTADAEQGTTKRFLRDRTEGLEAEVARLTSELAAARENEARIEFAEGPHIEVVRDPLLEEWRVYRLRGPRNDIERTLIGEGDTWREALDAARRAGEGEK